MRFVISRDMPIRLSSGVTFVFSITVAVPFDSHGHSLSFFTASVNYLTTLSMPVVTVLPLMSMEPLRRKPLIYSLLSLVSASLKFLSKPFLKAWPRSLLSGSTVYWMYASSS